MYVPKKKEFSDVDSKKSLRSSLPAHFLKHHKLFIKLEMCPKDKYAPIWKTQIANSERGWRQTDGHG